EGTDLEDMSSKFVGPTAIVYHPEDTVAPANVLVEFAKDAEKFKLRAGWLNGTVLDESGIEALANLPGKDALRPTLLRAMLAAPTDFVRVLAAAPTDFLDVLNARKDAI